VLPVAQLPRKHLSPVLLFFVLFLPCVVDRTVHTGGYFLVCSFLAAIFFPIIPFEARALKSNDAHPKLSPHRTATGTWLPVRKRPPPNSLHEAESLFVCFPRRSDPRKPLSHLHIISFFEAISQVCARSPVRASHVSVLGLPHGLPQYLFPLMPLDSVAPLAPNDSFPLPAFRLPSSEVILIFPIGGRKVSFAPQLLDHRLSGSSSHSFFFHIVSKALVIVVPAIPRVFPLPFLRPVLPGHQPTNIPLPPPYFPLIEAYSQGSSSNGYPHFFFALSISPFLPPSL